MALAYSNVSGMFIATCDWARSPGDPPFCPSEFRTASVLEIIPKQLSIAGWRVRNVGRGQTRTKQYLCGAHA